MTQKGKRVLLVVEDDPSLQTQMRWAFDSYEVVVAGTREAALAQVRRFEPSVVTMDLGLPPSPNDPTEGFLLLPDILSMAPDTKVIVLTGQSDRASAVKAIGLGAYDFCAKPFDPDILNLIVERAYQLHDLQEANRRLGDRQQNAALAGIVTGDPEMQRVCRMVEKVAPTNATVLLLGDSGTGKELLARAVHALSGRRGGRFVAINCAAIPETLLESELFGYEKGSFTGAMKQSLGKIEIADGGTLFLDEIGDMPLAIQSKLLRFLQERVIERVGGRDEIRIDVRVVCATHQPIEALVEQGRFRGDLFFRLAEIVIKIPPLSRRPGDASLLAQIFARRFADEQRRGAVTLLPETLAAIEAYAWPGNVRELENRIKRAVIMADATSIRAADIGLEAERDDAVLNLRRVRDEAERRAVVRALGRVNGNMSKAADLLGISRPTLYDLLDRFGLRQGASNETADQGRGVE